MKLERLSLTSSYLMVLVCVLHIDQDFLVVVCGIRLFLVVLRSEFLKELLFKSGFLIPGLNFESGQPIAFTKNNIVNISFLIYFFIYTRDVQNLLYAIFQFPMSPY